MKYLKPNNVKPRLTRIKIVGTVFAILTLFCFSGVIFSRKLTLAKTEGKVESVSLVISDVGRHSYSTTRFKLKGSIEKFVIREKGDANSFTDRLGVGDTITLYSKTWVQLLSGSFGYGNVFRVQKNGIVLYDEIEGLRVRGIYLTLAFLIIVLCGLWFYSMERKKKPFEPTP
jgi:hypothetical protein